MDGWQSPKQRPMHVTFGRGLVRGTWSLNIIFQMPYAPVADPKYFQRFIEKLVTTLDDLECCPGGGVSGGWQWKFIV